MLIGEIRDQETAMIAMESALTGHLVLSTLHTNNAPSTVSRLTEILTEYPNFSEMDRVYYVLAESYYKGQLTDQSIPYFQKLISDYPNSKYAALAVKRMAEIEKNPVKKD